MIGSGIDKNTTAMLSGGVYMHTNAAHNLLSTMRVGMIRGGCEVEIWKWAQKEDKGQVRGSYHDCVCITQGAVKLELALKVLLVKRVALMCSKSLASRSSVGEIASLSLRNLMVRSRRPLN